MADGRVITGYSKPYVAVYTAPAGTATTATYSSGQALARGVQLQIEPGSGSDNKFYANNIVAEDAGSTFSNGTATIAVDGLKAAARELIFGLPEADASGWVKYGSEQEVPYLGFGCIVRYMEDGATTYEPLILPKIKFNTAGTDASTQEEEIDFQTQELTANIYRDDTPNQNWKWEGTAQTTEALAEAAIKTAFSIT